MNIILTIQIIEKTILNFELGSALNLQLFITKFWLILVVLSCFLSLFKKEVYYLIGYIVDFNFDFDDLWTEDDQILKKADFDLSHHVFI